MQLRRLWGGLQRHNCRTRVPEQRFISIMSGAVRGHQPHFRQGLVLGLTEIDQSRANPGGDFFLEGHFLEKGVRGRRKPFRSFIRNNTGSQRSRSYRQVPSSTPNPKLP